MSVRQILVFAPCYFMVMTSLYCGVYWLMYGHLPPWN